MELTFLIPTLFGLEGVAAQECRRLGLREVTGETGRVLCKGTEADLPRLNLNLRTGERVLVLLGRFPADSFEALFDHTYRLPWEQFIPRDGKFPVRGHCVDSKLASLPDCQAILQKAAAKRLGERYGLTRLPATGALYQIQFTILKDFVTLSLDATGPSLHKRGYRARSGDAPLRETLAAGLVLLSRYRGKGPFRDPFCGSGTIAIEAALIAKNRAPGLDRAFSAQKWGFVPQSAWLDAAAEAMDGEFSGSYDIWGGDIDPACVELARENAALAGVDDVVRFEAADALTLPLPQGGGRVVTNPPYGERLGTQKDAETLCRKMGAAWKGGPAGWEFYILSSLPDLERLFDHGQAKKRKLYNGKLLCNLYQYH